MKLEYALSKEHLLAFSRLSCHRLRPRGGARWLLAALNALAWACIAFGTASFVSMYEKAPDLASGLNFVAVPIVLAAVAIFAASGYGRRLQTDVIFADDSCLRMPQSISAGVDGLEIRSRGVHASYEWSRFVEVLEDVAVIYLFLDVSYAVLVPKSSFHSSEDMRLFLSWARRAESSPHVMP